MLVRPRGELGAGAEAELGQDVIDVHLDGAYRQIQLDGDLAVAEAARHQRRNFRLPTGEACRRSVTPRLLVEAQREGLVERQPPPVLEEPRRPGRLLCRR